MWPQIILISLWSISIGINISRHGKQEITNAWHAILSIIILSTILYFGGFWKSLF